MTNSWVGIITGHVRFMQQSPGEHPQAHAAGRQVLHGVDQVDEGAAEAVERPDDARGPQRGALQVQRLGAVRL